MIGTIFKCLLTLGLACKVHYHFVAQNINSCDLFSGKVSHNLSNGTATTRFYFPSGSECEGYSSVNYYPPGGGCIGQRGGVYTNCSDGRFIEGNWTVTSSSCTVGQGTAEDTWGDHYQFTFGHTAKEAVTRVNALRETLGCARIDVDGAIMSVQGKILRTKQ